MKYTEQYNYKFQQTGFYILRWCKIVVNGLYFSLWIAVNKQTLNVTLTDA